MRTHIDLGELPEIEAVNGLLVKDLAISAYRVWHLAQNLAVPEFSGLREEDQTGWMLAAELLAAEPEELEGQGWRDVAGWLAKRRGTQTAFEDLTGPEQKAWEAVARHLVNVITLESDDFGSIPGHEEHWQGLALVEVEPEVEPQEQQQTLLPE